jgi:hypothetical protein
VSDYFGVAECHCPKGMMTNYKQILTKNQWSCVTPNDMRRLTCDFDRVNVYILRVNVYFSKIVTTTTMHTVKLPNGQLLTGKLWRKEHPFFNDLPFYSNIARADDIGDALGGLICLDDWYGSLLLVSNRVFLILISFSFNRNLDED